MPFPKYNLEKIKQLSLHLAEDVKSSSFEPDYVVGIANGGLYPAQIIAERLGIPLQITKLQRPATNDSGLSRDNLAEITKIYLAQEPVFADGYDLEVKPNDKILVVDDKIHTGKTILKQRNFCPVT